MVAYNDEPPGLTSAEDNIYSGHTKGVLVADDKSGFWMVHSVPLYPEITSITLYYIFNGPILTSLKFQATLATTPIHRRLTSMARASYASR